MVLFIGFLIWFLVPAPPKKIVMTTGADNGLYYRFGQQLAKELAKEKITLEVLPSAGSLENIERLNQPESKIHVGILQGGVGQVSDNPNISALASVFDEQVWVFYRKTAFKEPLTKITQLENKSLSIGLPGSGTRDLGLKLLELNQIDVKSAKLAIQLKEFTAAQSLKALNANELDAVMLVSGPQAPIVIEYLRNPNLAVMNFEQADA
jgi:TRAP-type uncharacterized transport system substrate-binding protein